MRIFIDMLSDFFLCHLKSMKILYNVTIINKEIKIDRVVIIPNLFIGSKSVNEKLKNPTAVVAEVKNTGLPIFWICSLKNLNLFFTFLEIFCKCIKSDIVIIKITAGIIIITNSIPSYKILDNENVKNIERNIENRFSNIT